MAEFYIQKERKVQIHKIIILSILVIASIFLAIPDSNKEATVSKVDFSGIRGNFVKRYALISMKEGKAYQIPPSIILAVGLYNSEGYDNSRHNNLFRLKPDTNWDGKVISFKDDNGQYTLKKYDSVWEGFRDFSVTVDKALEANKINKKELTLYGWAKTLEDAGMCNADSTMSIIYSMNLNRFDTLTVK
tara:strand:+ start:755 stop:1321 length:567 start_codon:yes stop_codon:yes gene_type:complete